MKRFLTMLLALVLVLSLTACGEKQAKTDLVGDAAQDAQQETQTPEKTEDKKDKDDKKDKEEPAVPAIELGDDLSGFTLSINGTVFQFPCSLADVQAAGWEAKPEAISNGVYTKQQEPGRGKTLLTFYYKGDESLNVDFISSNVSDQYMPLNECPVVGVWNNGAEGIEWILPGNFKVVPGTTTKEDVIAKYGGKGVAYTFGEDRYYEFNAYSKVYSFRQCVNIPDTWGE